jgi:hypothetical protein
MSPRARERAIHSALALAHLLGLAGCGALLGVSFDDARPYDDAGATTDEASTAGEGQPGNEADSTNSDGGACPSCDGATTADGGTEDVACTTEACDGGWTTCNYGGACGDAGDWQLCSLVTGGTCMAETYVLPDGAQFPCSPGCDCFMALNQVSETCYGIPLVPED